MSRAWRLSVAALAVLAVAVCTTYAFVAAATGIT